MEGESWADCGSQEVCPTKNGAHFLVALKAGLRGRGRSPPRLDHLPNYQSRLVSIARSRLASSGTVERRRLPRILLPLLAALDLLQRRCSGPRVMLRS